MNRKDGDVSTTTVVAKKIKKYFDVQRHEQLFDLSKYKNDALIPDLNIYYNNYVNSRNDWKKSKANILRNEVKKMQSKLLSEKEIEEKIKLEKQMAHHNHSFILSPYACPVVDGERRPEKFMKKRSPKKRILSAGRSNSAGRITPVPKLTAESRKKPSLRADREHILNLTAKLLVATENVALPKKRQQSRESQTSTEESFPSIPLRTDLQGVRTKSSYSDPGIHTLTKEAVDKLNYPGNKQITDELSSVDSGSLTTNHPVHLCVESCNQGYIVRKKPASYPSSLNSQNSRLSSKVPILSNNFTVIKDKPEDFDSYDDDFFDHELTEGIPISSSNSDWSERIREKQLSDISTQTVQNRGTQTYKEFISGQDTVEEEDLVSPLSRNKLSNTHTEITTKIAEGSEVYSDNSPLFSDRVLVKSENMSTQTLMVENMSTQTVKVDVGNKVLTYQIYINTGDRFGASTKSDIKINVFGEYGDSGDRLLLKSKTTKVPFQRGQTDVFDLDCKNLGKLSNIRIGHNGTSASDGWYCERIFIKPGLKAEKAYMFISNKWFSAKEGDGQIMRDVTLSQEILITELPPILPRRYLSSKITSSESELSEITKPKIPSKTKSIRDKKYFKKEKKHHDTTQRFSNTVPLKYTRQFADDINHNKHVSTHHRLTDSSTNSISSSSDSESERGKQQIQKRKRREKYLQKSASYGKPQANLSGINNITKKTHQIQLQQHSSTDTSISSVANSPNEMKISCATQKNNKHSILKHKNDIRLESINKLYSANDSSGETKMQEKYTHIPKKHVSKKKSKIKTNIEDTNGVHSPNDIQDNLHEILSIDSKEEGKGRKGSGNLASGSHGDDSKAFVEPVIVPQETVMVEAAVEAFEETIQDPSEKSDTSSQSSEEITKSIANDDTDEEKVEFSNKNTIKQYSESEADDLYMAGFRAGISANKSKHQDKALEEKESFNENVIKRGTSIHQACEDGDLDHVKELISSIPDLKDKLDERGWAPIHISAAFGHLDMLKWLSINGVNLSSETRTGYTPIHVAAMNGHVNCIMILSAMGCSISCQTVDHLTPLHLAAMSGHIECVKWLLSNRAKIDAEDMNERTALQLAEEYQHKECVTLLKGLEKELVREDSVMSLLRNKNALRKNSVNEESPPHEEIIKSEEEKEWFSDTEETSSVVGRGGDDRPEEKRRISVSRKMSKQEEEQAQQLQEKKRNYNVQRKTLERRQSSFLDSIRQDIDGIEEDF